MTVMQPVAEAVRRLSLALALAGVALLALGTAAGMAARSRPEPGPLLREAAQRGVLRVAVRAYPRPAPPGSTPPAEADAHDAAVAGELGRRLGLPVELQLAAAGAPLPAADLLLAGSAEAGALRAGASYDDAPARAVVLRRDAAQSLAQLAGRVVCTPAGSPWDRALVQRHRAEPRRYPSSVHAAAAFLAGECAALVDDAVAVARYLRLAEWRFYRPLPGELPADGASRVALSVADADSAALVDAALRAWRGDGGPAAARARRTGGLAHEVSLLADGNVCH